MDIKTQKVMENMLMINMTQMLTQMNKSILIYFLLTLMDILVIVCNWKSGEKQMLYSCGKVKSQ